MVLQVLIMKLRKKAILLLHLILYISFQKLICKNELMMFVLLLCNK